MGAFEAMHEDFATESQCRAGCRPGFQSRATFRKSPGTEHRARVLASERPSCSARAVSPGRPRNAVYHWLKCQERRHPEAAQYPAYRRGQTRRSFGHADETWRGQLDGVPAPLQVAGARGQHVLDPFGLRAIGEGDDVPACGTIVEGHDRRAVGRARAPPLMAHDRERGDAAGDRPSDRISDVAVEARQALWERHQVATSRPDGTGMSVRSNPMTRLTTRKAIKVRVSKAAAARNTPTAPIESSRSPPNSDPVMLPNPHVIAASRAWAVAACSLPARRWARVTEAIRKAPYERP